MFDVLGVQVLGWARSRVMSTGIPTSRPSAKPKSSNTKRAKLFQILDTLQFLEGTLKRPKTLDKPTLCPARRPFDLERDSDNKQFGTIRRGVAVAPSPVLRGRKVTRPVRAKIRFPYPPPFFLVILNGFLICFRFFNLRLLFRA